MVIHLFKKGSDNMNPLAPLNNKQVDYIRNSQRCWLNIAEGG